MKNRRGPENAPYFLTLAMTLEDFVARGLRKFLITSSGPGEGKSTITAGLGRTLARSGRQPVVLVDADGVHPTLHDLLDVSRTPGVGEILQEMNQVELSASGSEHLGMEDLLELIPLQARTGRLSIRKGNQEFSIGFQKGKISGLRRSQNPPECRLGSLLVRAGEITAAQKETALQRQRESGYPLGRILCGLGYLDSPGLESSLRLQVKEGFQRILSLRNPEVSFTESSAIDQNGGIPSRIGVDGPPAEWFGYGTEVPSFVSTRILRSLQQTSVEGLSLVPAGGAAYDLQSSQTASQFRTLLGRLTRPSGIVLVDSPPVCYAGHTATLSTLVDGVILVVRSDGLNSRAVQQAKEVLERARANLLGVVLNGVDEKEENALSYEYYAHQK